MFRLRLVPSNTKIPFMRWRFVAIGISLLTGLISIGLFFGIGLNKGIDFDGGIMMEVAMPTTPDIGAMRSNLSGLGLGEVALQEFGSVNDVLIRVQRQDGDEAAQQAAADKVKTALNDQFGTGIKYRRMEFVGPKVSGDLVEAAQIAITLAIFAMLVYIWFRFEWQFGIGAVVATVHDVLMTVGMFALTGMEFNLTSVAAILTIVGYSVNDTVVVYDRIRENLRKYKTMELGALIDLSVNETLSRTTMTSFTTFLAVLALFVFGGEVIRGFSFAMMWGIAIGTYSSIFVAAPVLIHFGLQKVRRAVELDADDAAA